jgi:hypothetical protein
MDFWNCIGLHLSVHNLLIIFDNQVITEIFHKIGPLYMLKISSQLQSLITTPTASVANYSAVVCSPIRRRYHYVVSTNLLPAWTVSMWIIPLY